HMNSELVGKAAVISGAGREMLNDKIDPSAGIVLNKKYGDYVNAGEPIAIVYGKKEKLDDAADELLNAYSFGDKKPENRPIIYKTVR
ncbi:MAG: hypothetical protein U0K18_02470, partial [Acutalibacteraceae bacterium]|nr:hypothetical protein [Acutalibacteraceae bacterium]